MSEISDVTLYTPLDPEFSGGVVAFHLNGVDPDAAHQWLYEARGFASASSGVVGGGLRLSPHIYNSLEQCDAAVEAVQELASGKAAL